MTDCILEAIFQFLQVSLYTKREEMSERKEVIAKIDPSMVCFVAHLAVMYNM